MTYRLTLHLPKIPPGPLTETFDRLVDLGPFLRVRNLLLQMFNHRQEMDAPTSRKVHRWLGHAGRHLEKAKIHNFKVKLKRDMLGDKLWRGRVKADLGGEAALATWEVRHARSIELGHEPSRPAVYQQPELEALRGGHVAPARETRPVKTDSMGHFRLMPIPRPRHCPPCLTKAQTAEIREARRLRRELRFRLWDSLPPAEKYGRPLINPLEFYNDSAGPDRLVYSIRPIPVTPDELRNGLPEDIGESGKNDVIPAKAKPQSRDPGSCREGALKKARHRDHDIAPPPLFGRDPGSATCGLARDDRVGLPAPPERPPP